MQYRIMMESSEAHVYLVEIETYRSIWYRVYLTKEEIAGTEKEVLVQMQVLK